ncbi:EamA family transporter [Sphingomonas sp. SUN019]|uniref:DMT family transporter n=1 Tax=Sphingomonas sp. SUN019 TaxID=2937788 RepID=UPI0021641110|nr:EamA family transporter [Sphingomonas sp. SUN019]UVO49317.1 EamA family transporter [Sphingomonas sp. SUN019]
MSKFQAPAQRRMDAVDWTNLAILSVMWGCAFFFLAIQLRELPPFTIVLLRVGLAALLLLGWAAVTRMSLPGPKLWPAFLVLALLNNVVPFALYGFAQQHIASALAGILNATTPLWGVLVAHLFTRDERATSAKIVGVLLGFAGVVTMIGGDALGRLGGNTLAQAACLAATLSYAFAAVWSRRFAAAGVKPLSVATGQLTAAAIVMIPLAAIVDRPWTMAMPGPAVWGAVAGMVLVSTVFAYVLYFRLVERAGASNSLLVTFTIPVVAILLGVAVLGETLMAKHFIGMALIALGLAAIDGRPWARLRGGDRVA